MPLGLDYKVRHLRPKSLKSVVVSGSGANVKKLFSTTLPSQTPTLRRSGGAYQNPELTWRVPIIPYQQQQYKNPFSGGGRSLARLLHIFFKFYIFGLFRRTCIFRMAEATFKFSTLIKSVLTRKLKFTLKGTWPELRDSHLNFRTPLYLLNRWHQRCEIW